jgi:hypothetical protein
MIIRRAFIALVFLIFTATNYAAGIPDKFTPGNYLKVFPHNQSGCYNGNRYSWCPLDKVTADNTFQGAQVIYLWKDLEPQKNHYDFSQIEKDLAYLSAQGKHLFIQIQDVWFKNEPEFYPVPQYIITYGGMLPRTPVGYVAKRWDPYVANRFAKLISKLGQRFDGEPYLEGINLPETAMSLTTSECSGYTAQKYYNQLVKAQDTLSLSFPNTVKIHYITNWPGCSGGRKVFIPKLLMHARDKGIGYGGPDLITDNAVLMDTVFSVYGEVDGELPLGMAADPFGSNQGLTVEQMIKYGMETLSLDYIFWSSADIKDALNAYINPVKIIADGAAANGLVRVRLVSGSTGALIYYTLNGGNPGLGSIPLLTSSVMVPQGTTIKAVAYLGNNHSIVSEKVISAADTGAP